VSLPLGGHKSLLHPLRPLFALRRIRRVRVRNRVFVNIRQYAEARTGHSSRPYEGAAGS
jgi:hypothetical protein